MVIIWSATEFCVSPHSLPSSSLNQRRLPPMNISTEMCTFCGNLLQISLPF